jgi:peroxiredoxin
MALLGLSLAVAVVAVYLVLAFVVGRMVATRWFDAGVAAGAGLGIGGWVADGSVWAGSAATVVAAGWIVASRRELGLPRSDGLRVVVGDPVPAFRARTADGVVFTEQDLAAAAPAVVVLYRGWWCPYCTTQLDEITREHEAFETAGLRVFALSVDPPEESRRLEARFNGRVTLLSDPEGTLLDAVGVRVPDGVPWYDRMAHGVGHRDISMPATLVIDASGRIVFAHRSKRIDLRPSVADILASLPGP